MARKKTDVLLDSIIEITAILTDEVRQPGNTVEFKERLALANFLRQLRLDGLKHEPDDEPSGLDKLRRKLINGDTQSGRNPASTKAPQTEEGEDNATG